MMSAVRGTIWTPMIMIRKPFWGQAQDVAAGLERCRDHPVNWKEHHRRHGNSGCIVGKLSESQSQLEAWPLAFAGGDAIESNFLAHGATSDHAAASFTSATSSVSFT